MSFRSCHTYFFELKWRNLDKFTVKLAITNTACPRSLDPFLNCRLRYGMSQDFLYIIQYNIWLNSETCILWYNELNEIRMIFNHVKKKLLRYIEI